MTVFVKLGQVSYSEIRLRVLEMSVMTRRMVIITKSIVCFFVLGAGPYFEEVVRHVRGLQQQIIVVIIYINSIIILLAILLIIYF